MANNKQRHGRLEWVDIPNAPKRRRRKGIASVDTVMFHRIHVGDPEGDDARTIANYFHGHDHEMPYTFIIPRAQPEEGGLVVVQQCIPLHTKTYHGGNWNWRSVGVGVVGDFRTMTPTPKQRWACSWIVQRIMDAVEYPFRHKQVNGQSPDFLVTIHGAHPDATSDPQKLVGGSQECPGKNFGPTFREVKARARAWGRLKV